MTGSLFTYLLQDRLKNISVASLLAKKFKKAQVIEQTIYAVCDELTGTLHQNWIEE